MTNQEAFDTVYKHLLQQKIATPYYRDFNEGLRCAVGALIPNDEYKEWFECHKITTVATHCNALDGVEMRLLTHFQVINDIVPPERWGAALEDCARCFGLTVPSSTGFKITVPTVKELVHAGA